MKFFIVIPAYNEGKRIGKVIQELKGYLGQVIVVDDGSTDDTYQIVKRMNVLVARHKVNLGQGAAIKTGCKAAWKLGAEAIITLDADGQHDPKHIPEFISKIREGNEIVFGSRNLGLNVPLARLLSIKIASIILNILFKIYRSDITCGYMAITKHAFKKINWESQGYGVQTEIVAKTGKRKLKYSEVATEAIYLDKYKGVTILNAIEVLPSVIKWRLFE